MANGIINPNLEIALWFMVSVIFGIISIYFILKYRKMEEGTRSFIFGVIIFTVGFGVSRTIETIRRYFGVGTYYEGLAITGLNLALRLLYYLILWVGIGTLYYVFEKYVMNQRTKYVLTVFSIITCCLSWTLYLTQGASMVLNIYIACFFIVALFPIILFAYCSKTSMNRSQQIAWLIMIIGFVFLLLGVLGDTPEAFFITQNLPQTFVRYFTPISEACGAIIMAYSLSIIYKYV
jgi:hypothetical protein